jgi:hypothetical protein
VRRLGNTKGKVQWWGKGKEILGDGVRRSRIGEGEAKETGGRGSGVRRRRLREGAALLDGGDRRKGRRWSTTLDIEPTRRWTSWVTKRMGTSTWEGVEAVHEP